MGVFLQENDKIKKHRPIKADVLIDSNTYVINNGVPGRIWTGNLRIRSPTLYPIELQAQYIIINGGEGGIRTLGRVTSTLA